MSRHGRDGVVTTADLLAALAERDPGAAWQRADASRFERRIATELLLAIRPREFLDRFCTDLVRLELALSTLEAGPGKALAVLESFDERFWTSLGVAAWLSNRTSEQHAFFFHWLSDLHERVRTGWTAAARRLADTDLIAAQTTMRRFLEVAGWIDAAAVKHIPDMREPTDLWITHLPFFTATAAATLPEIDPARVDDAIRRSVTLASTLSSPAREWAACWNAVAWRHVHTDAARTATAEALELTRRLRTYRSDVWGRRAPNFARQVARLDSLTAYQLAKRVHSPAYAATLAAVASGVAEEPGRPAAR
jgi:hypothetical protein